mmetsp:Transcript_16521/g.36168  ORF Transcript_16521/g.36168 Transcript_16521/m.36168 type:complete len:1314 (+) Transcript_16521:153-4094(+)
MEMDSPEYNPRATKPERKAVPAFDEEDESSSTTTSTSSHAEALANNSAPQQRQQDKLGSLMKMKTAIGAPFSRSASTNAAGETQGRTPASNDSSTKMEGLGASSEEDSVAEMMDYLSEEEASSNLSSSERGQRSQQRKPKRNSQNKRVRLTPLSSVAASASTSDRSPPHRQNISGMPSVPTPGLSLQQKISAERIVDHSNGATSFDHRLSNLGQQRSTAKTTLPLQLSSIPRTSAFESPRGKRTATSDSSFSFRGDGSPMNARRPNLTNFESPPPGGSSMGINKSISTTEKPWGSASDSTIDGPHLLEHIPPENSATHDSIGKVIREASSSNTFGSDNNNSTQAPTTLPKFRDPQTCMWTASHAANCPSEDRSSSLVNVLLQPLPPNFDSETQLGPLPKNYQTLIRLNLWSVIDGHGGGCVATYASEVLLPHIAASVSRALGCAIVDRGCCIVNGQLRDANALDLDGLIQVSSDPGSGGIFSNPNSIHYRSPYERSDSETEEENKISNHNKTTLIPRPDSPAASVVSSSLPPEKGKMRSSSAGTRAAMRLRSSPSSSCKSQVARDASTVGNESARSPVATSKINSNSDSSQKGHSTPKDGTVGVAQAGRRDECDASVSSVKTSVKTAASLANKPLVGTHSPHEVAAITRAITASFLAVDEGWINSIDPVATHQTSCQSNGRWNSGACALVVFTVQRLDWTSVSEPDREKESRGPEKFRNTSQNRDAARRRMLDYAARTKSASSVGSVSSTSSLTTEEVHASGLESEITETEMDDDDYYKMDHMGNYSQGGGIARRRNRPRGAGRKDSSYVDSLISPPAHCYRAHDAIMYTAHVGDCRAVMLGSAPPRTIKVRGGTNKTSSGDNDTTTDDDESSHHSSDETECLSSSDHDADSSEEEDYIAEERRKATLAANNLNDPTAASQVTASSGTVGGTSNSTSSASSASYRMIPRRVARQRNQRASDDYSGPFRPLPPLNRDQSSLDILDSGGVDSPHRDRAYRITNSNTANKDDISTQSSQSSRNDESSSDGTAQLPICLPPVTRPIDLTTDHSAYNPAEVVAVLRRCNNAPRAITAGLGGGIKRVAGSLAVTRALGDAYLKTPLLSFNPYKSHAPYITARPEVNCRPLVKGPDKVLILATDGVWERASGEDVLRWVRNFYEERVAEAERRNNRRQSNNGPDSSGSNKAAAPAPPVEDAANTVKSPVNSSVEGASRDLFETGTMTTTSRSNDGREVHMSRKREHAAPSPTGPNKRRKRNARMSYNVADVIVRRVLNKVRRARNISSLQALMSLPLGRARRSKHDDITSSVVDLSAFVD